MRKGNPFHESTASLIDIAFTLILFLVIAAVIAPEDVVEIKLPNNYAKSPQTLTVYKEMVIHVERDGSVRVEDLVLADGMAPDSVLFLLADTLLANYKSAQPDGKVILRADSGAVWDRPVQIMQAAGHNDLPISIALEPSQLAQFGQR